MGLACCYKHLAPTERKAVCKLHFKFECTICQYSFRSDEQQDTANGAKIVIFRKLVGRGYCSE